MDCDIWSRDMDCDIWSRDMDCDIWSRDMDCDIWSRDMDCDKQNGKMLMTWERKILVKIYGPTKENAQWRIKTNAELMTKYKAPDTVNVIKIRRLEWLRHVVRMNETRSVKKIFEGKLEGRRGRGRPRQVDK
jgi:hypothetical protein